MANPTHYLEHDTPRLTRAVQVLVALNVAILFLQWTVVNDADLFATLGFRDTSLSRTLWSAVSYSFAHYGFWHLAVNMFALLTFGPRLESVMGTRAFTLYYLWCGVGGAVAHLLFLRTGILVGATAAVLGVMYGYAQHWPDDQLALFGVVPVRAWTMIVVLSVAGLTIGMTGAADLGSDRTLYLAHLGGLAFGWLYLRTPPAASIERLRQRISPAPDYQDEAPPRPIPRTLPRQRTQRDEVDEIVAQSKAIAAQQQPAARALVVPARTSGEMRVAELDRVLDKISARGLESLTLEERAVLDAMARRLRGEG
ncbi:MAG TPA: rhomboid family intramembrane serine protease [Gemmatimonadaceae bacterium]|nr:rhomboid family intramembrane serine protease [Gemmatimonadaceae bacterium]